MQICNYCGRGFHFVSLLDLLVHRSARASSELVCTILQVWFWCSIGQKPYKKQTMHQAVSQVNRSSRKVLWIAVARLPRWIAIAHAMSVQSIFIFTQIELFCCLRNLSVLHYSVFNVY